MATYILTAPNGREIEIESATPPTDALAQEVFKAAGIGFEQPQAEEFTPDPEALKQIQANNEAYNSTGKKVIRGLRGVADFLTGAVEGIDSGTDSVLNGATFGFYEKLNPRVKEKREQLQQRAESVGLGGANKLAQGVAEFGGMGFNPVNGLLGKTVQVANNAGIGGKLLNYGANVAKAGIEGAGANILYGLGHSDNMGDYLTDGKWKSDATIGSVMGSAIPAVLPIAGAIGRNIATPLLGTTTGAGTNAIKTAFDAGKRKSKVFWDNIRGIVDSKEAVQQAQSALKNRNDLRYKAYRDAMAVTGKKENVKLDPILDEFKKIKSEVGGGKLYLAEKDTVNYLDTIEKKLNSFAKDSKNKTVKDFDDLKQAIYSNLGSNPSSEALRVRTQLYNKVKNSIQNQAPEYAKIMKEFEEGSEAIKEFEKTLGLGYGKSPSQSLKKLQRAFRNDANSGYGNDAKLIRELEGEGNQLSDALAGQALSTVAGRGMSGAAGNLLSLGYSLANPSALPYVLASSPRLVGGLTYGLGRLSNYNLANPYIKQELARIISEND